MDDIDKFKQKWQIIENEVISRAHMTDNQGFVKAFQQLIQEDSLLAQKAGLIDDLRALRNVFMHRDREKYIAELEKHVLSDLDEVYTLVINPPSVLDIFKCDVFTAELDDEILAVMDTMSSQIYTHVPILDSGKLIGVFAYNSFFEWAHDVLRSEMNTTFEKWRICDIDRKYILPPTVFYNCINSNLPAGNVENIFRKRTTRKGRLDCIFITEDGSKSKPILGIITPWDIYKVR